jgi:hypothetical protein
VAAMLRNYWPSCSGLCNNTGNLGALEIDIPVIVWDTLRRKLFRFAIEYNADYYHCEIRDIRKKQLTEKRGWIYFPIIETSSDNFSNKPAELYNISVALCEKIQEVVYRK